MNDKIKELAEQAGMEDYPDRGINTLYGDKEIQKFAELIIKECVDCALWVGNINSAQSEPIRTAHAIKHRIFNKLLKVKDARTNS